MCYLLPPLAREVTNFSVQNKTEMTTMFQDVAYRYTNLRSKYCAKIISEEIFGNFLTLSLK
jgi:thermostable 8-oxoguanine DNA glycosylase